MVNRILRNLQKSAVLLGAICFSQLTLAVGLMPIPVFDSAQIDTITTHNPDSDNNFPDGLYTYHYTVTNPASNTGDIWQFQVDVSTTGLYATGYSSYGLTIPFGAKLYTFREMIDERQSLIPPGVRIVPFGQTMPANWVGGFGRDKMAMFAVLDGQELIVPDSSRSGFAMQSPMPPGIRKAIISPNWAFVVEDYGSITKELQSEANAIVQQLPVYKFVLGPAQTYQFGAYTHWRHFGDDLKQASTLGWILDTALSAQVLDLFTLAQTARNNADGSLAKQYLQTISDLIAAATPAQLTQEARDLIRLNVVSLIKFTRDTTYPVDPDYVIEHSDSPVLLGYPYTLTVRIFDKAHDNTPMSNWQVAFLVTDGPNKGMSLYKNTNAQGEAVFTYTSRQIGYDDIRIWAGYGEFTSFDEVLSLEWKKGVDLVIGHLGPKIIESKGGRPLTILESTFNLGKTAAGASVTRFFLSESEVFDPATAREIGNRLVDPLEANTAMAPFSTIVTLPKDIAKGRYYLTACADADESVIENDEANNCSDVKVRNVISVAITLENRGNKPPVCDQALPEPANLWPPNHKWQTIQIIGATDPDGDEVRIKVTSIRQDEPVNGTGDGRTVPDGRGVDSAVAEVRAERAGSGTGRVYTIKFEAEDDKGAYCDGTVTVSVPHDLSLIHAVVNEGALYDSTSLK